MWRLFLLKTTAGNNPSRQVSKGELFYSRGEQLKNLLEQRNSSTQKNSSIQTGLAWETNIAAVILFWDNNMAVITSYENALCSMSFKEY